jgi:hypothetical protein
MTEKVVKVPEVHDVNAALESEIAKLKAENSALQNKLANPRFVSMEPATKTGKAYLCELVGTGRVEVIECACDPSEAIRQARLKFGLAHDETPRITAVLAQPATV